MGRVRNRNRAVGIDGHREIVGNAGKIECVHRGRGGRCSRFVDRRSAPAIRELEGVAVALACKTVALSVPNKSIGSGATLHTLDIGDAASDARSRSRGQIGRDAGRIRRVIKSVGPSDAAVDRPAESGSILKNECIIARAADDFFYIAGGRELIAPVRGRNRSVGKKGKSDIRGNARKIENPFVSGNRRFAHGIRAPVVRKHVRVAAVPGQRIVGDIPGKSIRARAAHNIGEVAHAQRPGSRSGRRPVGQVHRHTGCVGGVIQSVRPSDAAVNGPVEGSSVLEMDHVIGRAADDLRRARAREDSVRPIRRRNRTVGMDSRAQRNAHGREIHTPFVSETVSLLPFSIRTTLAMPLMPCVPVAVPAARFTVVPAP